MSEPADLEEALLVLGLEDLIPLPEALSYAEASDLVGEVDVVSQVASTLTGLLRLGRIQIWANPWHVEPDLVGSIEAERLLRIADQYRFGSPADLERRVYYVNVDNLHVEE